ncbi:MAG: hypothetical protein IT343_23000 [Candidatus Melainabacteria bacterium]|jgi:UPF0716 family protein affecting phage T7 exclusion|nr:hypothetical protein [Candidatus Melainabacteria bacterium]
MNALLLADVHAVLSIGTVVLLLVLAAVAVIGTRIVRAKEKQQVRKWRLERKHCEPNEKD